MMHATADSPATLQLSLWSVSRPPVLCVHRVPLRMIWWGRAQHSTHIMMWHWQQWARRTALPQQPELRPHPLAWAEMTAATVCPPSLSAPSSPTSELEKLSLSVKLIFVLEGAMFVRSVPGMILFLEICYCHSNLVSFRRLRSNFFYRNTQCTFFMIRMTKENSDEEMTEAASNHASHSDAQCSQNAQFHTFNNTRVTPNKNDLR